MSYYLSKANQEIITNLDNSLPSINNSNSHSSSGVINNKALHSPDCGFIKKNVIIKATAENGKEHTSKGKVIKNSVSKERIFKIHTRHNSTSNSKAAVICTGTMNKSTLSTVHTK